MRVALVSDVHGNAIAFDAVVDDLAGDSFDAVVSLGDVAQGGPQPAEVVDRLRELAWPCVFGNSDEFLLTLKGNEDADPESEARALEVADWSAAQLGDDRLEFLRQFAPTVELDLDGCRVICCHATPRSNETVILPDTPRDTVVGEVGDAAVVACGHVHLQWLRRVGSATWISVGSAGMAYEHTQPLAEQPFEPWAEYAVISAGAGRLSIDFRRVPFDAAKVVAAIGRSGMPFSDRAAARWRRATERFAGRSSARMGA
jgi:predicted phosphodiesterase